jgi:hypothetical protein
VRNVDRVERSPEDADALHSAGVYETSM